MDRSENGRVLVADDNRVNRIKLAHAVEQLGHRADAAEDGPTALSMLAARPYDVLLLDIVMPEMDGFEVLGRIKADPSLRDIPVIVISAVDEMESVVRCIEMGAEDHLSKPFNPALLRARLTTSLARKRLRDLERAYLQQELMLRQNEKLATLGRMSAGLAHELNNPAAAALRAVDQLSAAVSALASASRRLGAATGSYPNEIIDALEQEIRARIRSADGPGAVARGRTEDEIEDWLDDLNVAGASDAASALAAAGFTNADLERMVEETTPADPRTVATWIGATASATALLEEVREGSARVCDVVGALKTYSFMDRSPVQSIDVHQGIEDTLTVLRSRLGHEITVHREYGEGLPTITVRGSELNQVWTNLLENSVDALSAGDGGRIVIRTSRDEGFIRVEIEDDGGGIDPDVLPRIFDPFFTTKPPGQGFGLGLTLVHTIVVQTHGGEVAAHSDRKQTTFTVRLPLEPVIDGP